MIGVAAPSLPERNTQNYEEVPILKLGRVWWDQGDEQKIKMANHHQQMQQQYPSQSLQKQPQYSHVYSRSSSLGTESTADTSSCRSSSVGSVYEDGIEDILQRLGCLGEDRSHARQAAPLHAPPMPTSTSSPVELLNNANVDNSERWVAEILSCYPNPVLVSQLEHLLIQADPQRFIALMKRHGGVRELVTRRASPDRFIVNVSWSTGEMTVTCRSRPVAPTFIRAPQQQIVPQVPQHQHQQPQMRIQQPIPQMQEQHWRGGVESQVVGEATRILREASGRSLKAVELANTLRARLGKEKLAHVRELFGGLLNLLERHPMSFRVDRIAKCDCVTLLQTFSPSASPCIARPGASSPQHQHPSVTQTQYNNQHTHTLSQSHTHDRPVERMPPPAPRPWYQLNGSTPGSSGSLSGELDAPIPARAVSNAPFCGSHVSPPGLMLNDDQLIISSGLSSSTGSVAGGWGTSPPPQIPKRVPSPMSPQVLSLLTSDQLVPTQLWPASAHDWPFVQRILDEMRLWGGDSITISKLRGALKGRLGITSTIKSVPLKALLAAYGQLFDLRGNRVSLLPQAMSTMQ